MTIRYRIGGSHGPNGHAPRTGNKQEDNNLQFLLTILLFHLVHGHHQIFVLLTQQQHFHLGILHGLVLSIGLSPNFDSLGPYQIFVLDLWDA